MTTTTDNQYHAHHHAHHSSSASTVPFEQYTLFEWNHQNVVDGRDGGDGDVDQFASALTSTTTVTTTMDMDDHGGGEQLLVLEPIIMNTLDHGQLDPLGNEDDSGDENRHSLTFQYEPIASSSSCPQLDDNVTQDHVQLKDKVEKEVEKEEEKNEMETKGQTSSTESTTPPPAKPQLLSKTVTIEDDALTNLSWLQNLSMCMSRLDGGPPTTPPTPPASPVYLLNNASPSLVCLTNVATTSPYFKSKCKNKKARPDTESTQPTKPPSSTQSKSKKRMRFARGAPVHEVRKTTAGGLVQTTKSFDSCPSALEQPVSMPEVTIDFKVEGVKPPHSYASLICMALKSTGAKMTLNGIYNWIKENFVFYRFAEQSWRVSSKRGG